MGSSTSRVFIKWSGIGLVLAAFLIWVQTGVMGGPAGLLEVGVHSSLRPMIEEQLGEIPLAEHRGHDGQIFYAIALDLKGEVVPPLLDHASYRYRRILYPLVSSGFGVLDGWALLYAMIAVNAASMAVSVGLVAAMAARAGKSELLALTVALNPGVWLSVEILTSDVFALALMLVGLFVFTTPRRKTGAVAFALSGIAREAQLTTPIPLGARFRDWRTIVFPIGLLVCWMTYLQIRFGDGFAVRGNLGPPFVGIIDASRIWDRLEPKELVFLVFALASVIVGAYFASRRSFVRWPLVAWVTLALISSDWVWNIGNNAARVFAPIVILAAIAYMGPERIESEPETISRA